MLCSGSKRGAAARVRVGAGVSSPCSSAAPDTNGLVKATSRRVSASGDLKHVSASAMPRPCLSPHSRVTWHTGENLTWLDREREWTTRTIHCHGSSVNETRTGRLCDGTMLTPHGSYGTCTPSSLHSSNIHHHAAHNPADLEKMARPPRDERQAPWPGRTAS